MNSTRWSSAVLLGILVGFVFVTCGFAAGAPAPVVVERTPERGEELRVEGVVELVFDRPMDRASVQGAFSLSPGLTGSFSWPDERTLRFRPSADWPRDTSYTVTIGTGAADAEDRHLEAPYTFTFRTVGYLLVTQVIPAPGTEKVAADSTITVIFNRPVVPLLAISDPAAAKLPNPLTFAPAIEGRGEWLNTSIYVFTPSASLKGGTTYAGRVAAGLTDTTGGLLAEDFVFAFSTEPPTVVWTSPDEGADLVPVDSSVRVTFNMPIDPESARQAFTLRRAGALYEFLGLRVEGTFDVSGSALAFTPKERLAFGTEYVVSLAPGVKSSGGGAGMAEAYTWHFTTVPLPRIVGTDPRDGEADAYPYTSFSIHFNAPIVPESVMENVAIEPAPAPEEVHTYFREWDSTFVIDFGAQPSKEYVVHIGPKIADRYGNTTGQTLAVRFTTGPLDPVAWLHVPGRVGTYSAYQSARLFVAHRNTDRLDLALYRLTLKEYLEAERGWYSFTPPSEGRVRRWSVAVEAPQNELGYTAVDLVRGGGPLDPGIYFLELGAEGVPYDRWAHGHVLVVSAVNLTLKTDGREILAWATDLETGAPVAFLNLSAYDEDGNRAAEAATDGNGLASLPFPDPWGGITVLGEGPFTMGSPWWTDGIAPWEFGFESGYLEDWRAHIDTDRPIYRPGQTVHFRGVVRAEDDARYRLPDPGTIEVKVYDPSWELVHQGLCPLDGYGTFTGDLELPEGASLGEYAIQATLHDVTFSGSFQVAAYRPPEFEVVVTPEVDEIGRGEKTSAAVDVRYFFGGPVKEAPVEWNVLSGEYRFQPPQFERYRFTDVDDPWVCFDCWWRPREAPQVILSGSGTTDTAGRLVIEIPPAATAADSPSAVQTRGSRLLSVEASVRASDGQVLSGRSTIVLHRGDFYIGLAPASSVGRAGDEMRIDVVTVDWDGKRLPERSLDYILYRREWVNTYVEGEAGGGRWEWKTNDTEVLRGTLTTDAAAEEVLSFTPPEGGSYKVVVRGLDSRERLVQSSVFVWASGKEYVSWRRTNDDRIALVSDKGTYTPGETAKILIPSPFPGEQWALVTVERGTILRREVVLLTSNSTVYELPITADYVPNVYVSVVLVQGQRAAQEAAGGAPAVASHKVGYVGLAVEPIPQRLVITLAPSAEQALPGGEVSYDLSTTDAVGESVAASLAVDLVDKGILTLRPRTPDAIAQEFYGQRGLGVTTSSGLTISIDRLLLEQTRQARQTTDEERFGRGEVGTALPMAAVPEGGAEGMAADGAAKSAAEQLPAGVPLREEFADTAYWNGCVVTGPDGRAKVAIDLPDNLTTWVFRAVGVTQATQVGEATDELLVTKPLLVRPVVPRFFVVGDRVEVACLVNNNTDQGLVAEVTLGAVGLSVEGGTIQTASVPASGETKVTWWATVEDVQEVDLAVSAVAGEYSDAARPRLTTGPAGTLRVYRYTAPEVVGTAGELVAEGTRTEVIGLPRKYDDRQGELFVELDPSLAAGMREGLTYLEHFEYECTEQVVSRFLPNVLTWRALLRLEIKNAELEEKLPGLVEEGLTKLYVRQHSDGGWGWWWDDRSNPHLTAYVVFALTVAREAGFEVHPAALARGLDFLAGELVPARELDSSPSANRQAWILYVMAEAGRTKEVGRFIDDLFAARGKLAHYGRAYLALALSLLDREDDRVKTLLSDITNAAILSATGAHWEEANYDFWAMNTDTRSTAVILDALARLDPKNALISNVVRWLMVARKDGIWETTQETAWALISLTDWMVVTGELAGRYDYSVKLNDEPLAAGSVTQETVDEPVRLSVQVAKLLAEAGNRLTVGRGPGEGRLYYTAHLKVYLPVEDLPALDRGISVTRQYVPADRPAGETGAEVDSASVGEVVQVRLTIVAPHDLYYVVVEDPLPAGAEAIDPSLATTSRLAEEPGLTRERDAESAPWRWFPWWWRWYSRSELRDEKVVLFADYLPAGTYTYQYTFRATQPGAYHVIPTTAHEFYFPEVFGRSMGRLFTVTEEK